MADRRRLTAGQYCGAIVASRRVSGLLLTETVYHPGAKLHDHSHERGYFCLIRRGSYLERYEGRARTCEPGTVAFHPEGEVHSQRFGDRAVRSFNVEVQGRWRLRKPVHFHGGRVPWLTRRLFDEFRRDDPFSDLAIEGLMLEILAEVGRTSDGPKRERVAQWLRETVDLLQTRFKDRLSLDEIAREVGVHPVHLATRFRGVHGESIGSHQRRLRIEFACRALESTRQSLAAIAAEAGFADQAHFSRTFKRLMGVTPKEYRARAGPD